MSPKILLSTRFSFFGKSSWKSEFSTDPEMLFDTNRLLQRFWLFENITLPSISAQTDKNFHYFVLSSSLMPDWAKSRLSESCEKHMDQQNLTVRFAPPGPARKFQRVAMSKLAGDDPVAQVVLDDDDALSSDFIETLQHHLKTTEPFTPERGPHFITFPKGYALGLRAQSTHLWKQNYKFINLGLTMIGRANQKNIFAIAHRQAPKTFGYDHNNAKPMYIRTLSNVNDSHVSVTDKWRELTNWQDRKDIVSRFSWLPNIPFENYHKLADGKCN